MHAHSVFRIDEVLSIIFQSVYDFTLERWYYEDNPGGATDLAVLARTCKAFKDPALDRLWYQQPGLISLLHLVPDAIQKHKKNNKKRYPGTIMVCSCYLYHIGTSRMPWWS